MKIILKLVEKVKILMENLRIIVIYYYELRIKI